jgi:hypothetical protein
MRYAKLDFYNYDLGITDGVVEEVYVYVDSPRDIQIADISTEITANDGRIYVDGHLLLKEAMFVEDNTLTIKVSELRDI